ncbi:hypothetical protein CHS0354_001291 [Potamilus streckersoni]|uniref:Galactosylgalactosylxylosylprotein 3-beta-glucuronosyltransferase n=1 Tax=Potamilus streckersoni TaxID=2493646 RepID=A0AAE0VQH5_9BIVA|nr:hypothetical protein CHS0354_001291 [Potamilus streckersoni]
MHHVRKNSLESDKLEINHKPFYTQKGVPIIFAITPTYYRLEQKAELTRICQTFRLVKYLFWILVEDSLDKTSLVRNLLKNCKIPYAHLNALTPPKFKNIPGNTKFPRGVAQRNEALDWIRTNVNPKETQGVVYFADDDNAYDVRIFEEMRYTNVVSVWPVGLLGHKFESPIVKTGKVVGWIFVWGAHRPFPIDMASFSFNVQLLFLHQEAAFNYTAQQSMQESIILMGLNVTMSDLEPKANNCTEILVWHTRTQRTILGHQPKHPANFSVDLEV